MSQKAYQIVLSVDDISYNEDVTKIESWLLKNKNALKSLSDDQGCGCCVNIWEFECDEELVKSLPERLATIRI